MSGETEASVSGWTTDTLHVHMTKLIEGCASVEQFSIIQAKLDSIDELMEARFVTFRVLVESQAEKVALALTASKEAIDKAEIATSKAIDKAEIANDKRFGAIDELRKLLADQQRTLITRIEVDAAVGRIAERIADVASRLERAERS